MTEPAKNLEEILDRVERGVAGELQQTDGFAIATNVVPCASLELASTFALSMCAAAVSDGLTWPAALPSGVTSHARAHVLEMRVVQYVGLWAVEFDVGLDGREQSKGY